VADGLGIVHDSSLTGEDVNVHRIYVTLVVKLSFDEQISARFIDLTFVVAALRVCSFVSRSLHKKFVIKLTLIVSEDSVIRGNIHGATYVSIFQGPKSKGNDVAVETSMRLCDARIRIEIRDSEQRLRGIGHYIEAVEALGPSGNAGSSKLDAFFSDQEDLTY
jgi:hypothetical protein